jgi:hypothetical protein
MMCQFMGFLGLVVIESFLQLIALARVPKGNNGGMVESKALATMNSSVA